MRSETKYLLITGAGLLAFLAGLRYAKASNSPLLSPAPDNRLRGVIGDRKAFKMESVGPSVYQVVFHVIDPANDSERASLKTSRYIELPTALADIVYSDKPYPSQGVTQEQASSAQLYTMDREIERYIAHDNPNALLL